MAPNQPDANPLDITQPPPKGERVNVKAVPPYSALWAEVVRPLTRIIFALLALVLLVPFAFVFVADAGTRTVAFDWAKTILAPIVGFASAAVGYYYGTRSADSNEPDSNGDE